MNFSLCNEVLHPMPFADACALTRTLGYDGFELAPFTVTDDPLTMTDAQALAVKRTVEDAGLKVFGLHWLLVTPKPLSITTAEPAIHARTITLMRRLCELCALMGGSYLVHGSPEQRRIAPGQSRADAMARARDAFAQVADGAAAAQVDYCIEPLAPDTSDIINSVAEALEMVRTINAPNVATMIDTAAVARGESMSVESLIKAHWPQGQLRHIQLNDANRKAPGQGEMRFAPTLQALKEVGFPAAHQAIAVEPFIYEPDGPGCAARAIGYLRGLEESLG